MTATEVRRERCVIAYADGVDAPLTDPWTVAAITGHDPRNVEVLLGWTPREASWLSDPALQGQTILPGYALTSAMEAGRLTYLPMRLSALPRLLEKICPDVVVVSGVRRDGQLAFARSVGWAHAAARIAGAVVVEIDDGAPDLGGPLIPGQVVAVVDRPEAPQRVERASVLDDVDRAIGDVVASVVPRDATLQFGLGRVIDATARALVHPVAIWSGFVDDGVASIARRGLLRGVATAAYTAGDRVADLAQAGQLNLTTVDETHALANLARLPRFTSCNTALQIGLDGSVNVERIGRRYIAGVGGHADFSAAAARSKDGLSIVALRSMTQSGSSTIVPWVETTSTQANDVELVITEHGVADLRGVHGVERARRLALVAAPEHRAWLLGS